MMRGKGPSKSGPRPAWDPEAPRLQALDDHHPRGAGSTGYPLRRLLRELPIGLHWAKPVVGQVEYRGSRQNNYITTLTGEGYRAPTHVVYDDTDPNPARRYKASP